MAAVSRSTGGSGRRDESLTMGMASRILAKVAGADSIGGNKVGRNSVGRLLRPAAVFRRLAYLDVPKLLQPMLPVAASQVLFALACSGATIVLRLLTDIALPGAGPFALTVPVVLIATLFGRWLAGLICLAVTSLHAWYFVLPVEGSFEFLVPADGPRVFVNILAGTIVVVFAEIFRRAMREAIEERETLLLELEHRVKNNFASVASLLRLQMRKAHHGETEAALTTALGRVESFALANSFLYRSSSRSGTVDMQHYLNRLCESLGASFAGEGEIKVLCRAEPANMPRDRAIVVGLLVNETVTNSVKHAFAGRSGGVVSVTFTSEPDNYRLIIADNGVGLGEEHRRHGSLGLSLIESLAKQADGEMQLESGGGGTTFAFDLGRLA